MSAPTLPLVKVWDGTNAMAVKPASTAPTVTDPAAVVSISPNTPAVQTTGAKAATSTLSGVAAVVASTTLLAANANRLGATIQNDSSSAILYIKLGTTAAAASGGYTVSMEPGGYYEVPFNYTGKIDGIWAAATGFANVDELTA